MSNSTHIYIFILENLCLFRINEVLFTVIHSCTFVRGGPTFFFLRSRIILPVGPKDEENPPGNIFNTNYKMYLNVHK